MEITGTVAEDPGEKRFWPILLVFLKLGFFGFGGPAVHVAMMESELVTRRRWLSRERFLDLLGATNLIPGPNSTEMAIHLGLIRFGWRGLLAAGFGFIMPAACISAAFAWAYVAYSRVPSAEPMLAGIKPVVVAIIAVAVWRLRHAVKASPYTMTVSVVAFAAVMAGLNEVIVLFVTAIVGGAAQYMRKQTVALVIILAGVCGLAWCNAGVVPDGFPVAQKVTLLALFLYFLRIGSLLYGSGYVLIAFLQGDVVDHYHWITYQQLLDAVAVGQLTPGPLSSTATFIGYLLHSWQGAVVATIGMFLPSFVLVLLLHRMLPHIRRWKWSSAFLDNVNAAAVALMAAVCFKLGLATVTGIPAVLILLAALGANVRWPSAAPLLIAAGALAGYLLHAAGWTA